MLRADVRKNKDMAVLFLTMVYVSATSDLFSTYVTKVWDYHFKIFRIPLLMQNGYFQLAVYFDFINIISHHALSLVNALFLHFDLITD